MLVVYETSSLGYVLYDDVTAWGFECSVLATSRLARSWRHRRNKTDERDAQLLFELGDLERFPNRRCLASYAGLVPSSDESGEANDRKGHITHQGPSRLRRALCQAVQHWVRWDPEAKARYRRLVARGAGAPKRSPRWP